jgi:large subunit ribosomal protein L22
MAQAKRRTAAPAAEGTGSAEPRLYKASLRKVHVAPRKARLVVDLIRGRNVVQALGILDNTNKKSAPLVKALLKSAIANAEQHDRDTDVDALVVKEAYVDGGQVLKRFSARAMGRAARIRKRSSHITLKVG